jgi:hypothetical protein
MGRMKHLAVVLLITLVGVSLPAQKTLVDGNTLDDSCRYERQREDGVKLSNDEELGKATFCIGYIRGVLDEIWMQQNVPDEPGAKLPVRSKICMPDNISNSQGIKVALKYLHDNPAKLQLTGNHLIRLSMQEAFPCKSP